MYGEIKENLGDIYYISKPIILKKSFVKQNLLKYKLN